MKSYFFSFFYIFIFTSNLFSFNFSVASYNVENLFDMVSNGTEYKEYKPYNYNWTRTNFKKKLLNISEVICELNADIIGLQEIENEHVLKALQKNLRLIGCKYKYLAITHKKKSAIQTAVLSKIFIQKSKELVVHRNLGYRPILELKLMIDKYPLYIYVNHWKSKFSPESRRIRSAKILVKRLASLPLSSEYILLGDFNSDYNEYRHLKREHNDRFGKTGINHILKSIDISGKMIRKESREFKGLSHYNLWLELPNYKRWSHNFFGDKQGLDSILIPETLINGRGIEYVKNSFSVFKKKYLFHSKGYIYRWLLRKNRHQGEGYSDHLPIVAQFSTTKVFEKEKRKIPNASIFKLYNKHITFPLRLKRVKVVSLEKNKIVIEDKYQKKISVYGVKNEFLLGSFYDIVIYGRKLYKGHYEVIDFELEKSYDKHFRNKR